MVPIVHGSRDAALGVLRPVETLRKRILAPEGRRFPSPLRGEEMCYSDLDHGLKPVATFRRSFGAKNGTDESRSGSTSANRFIPALLRSEEWYGREPL
jgi:hypothetical protein